MCGETTSSEEEAPSKNIKCGCGCDTLAPPRNPLALTRYVIGYVVSMYGHRSHLTRGTLAIGYAAFRNPPLGRNTQRGWLIWALRGSPVPLLGDAKTRPSAVALLPPPRPCRHKVISHRGLQGLIKIEMMKMLAIWGESGSNVTLNKSL